MRSAVPEGSREQEGRRKQAAKTKRVAAGKTRKRVALRAFPGRCVACTVSSRSSMRVRAGQTCERRRRRRRLFPESVASVSSCRVPSASQRTAAYVCAVRRREKPAFVIAASPRLLFPALCSLLHPVRAAGGAQRRTRSVAMGHRGVPRAGAVPGCVAFAPCECEACVCICRCPRICFSMRSATATLLRTHQIDPSSDFLLLYALLGASNDSRYCLPEHQHPHAAYRSAILQLSPPSNRIRRPGQRKSVGAQTVQYPPW